MVTKATKEYVDATGRRKVKGNMDIELAVHAMELAGQIDEMVLFSGDGDFRPLVEAVQRRGVRVTVVSSIASQPPMAADELRRQADIFTDLTELRAKVGRDPSERPPRERSEIRPAVRAACDRHNSARRSRRVQSLISIRCRSGTAQITRRSTPPRCPPGRRDCALDAWPHKGPDRPCA